MNNDRFFKRVLVFPGGTEVGLEIARSLRHCKEVQLFSAASGVKQHAQYVYERHEEIPPISDSSCLDMLINLVRAWNIDCIFPANPLVIDFLSDNRDKLPCVLIAPDKSVLAITRSKRATYDLLQGVIPTPKIYDKDEVGAEFPLFIKPDAMYGSQGARPVNSYAEYLVRPSTPTEIISEYLPGDEYTVDCFSDRNGKLLFVGPRTRERIRMGTSMHSEAPSGDIQLTLRRMAEIIQGRILMRGAWFFQAKVAADGVLKLLEVESRIAGTMALHRVQGINFSLLSIFDAFGLDVSVSAIKIKNVVIDRALTNRYRHEIRYDTVYVDLDDTIIINGRMNLEIIQFLYQCINKGKKIVLISKSLAPDPKAILERWRIYNLFDDIHWIDEAESKVEYITAKNSIFIDDSFSQRIEVEDKLGIPTFDPSMIELLMDERG